MAAFYAVPVSRMNWNEKRLYALLVSRYGYNNNPTPAVNQAAPYHVVRKSLFWRAVIKVLNFMGAKLSF